MKREQEKEYVGSTLSVHCIQSSSNNQSSTNIPHCDMEQEYKENNLFFYCVCYDQKTKRLNPLPKGISKLVNNCIKT